MQLRWVDEVTTSIRSSVRAKEENLFDLLINNKPALNIRFRAGPRDRFVAGG